MTLLKPLMDGARIKNYFRRLSFFLFAPLSVISIVVSFHQVLKLEMKDFYFYYTTAHQFIDRTQFYNALNLLFSSVILYIPFYFFSFEESKIIFLALLHFALFWSIHISLKISGNQTHSHYFFIFLFLAIISFPIRFSLGMGQNTLLAFAFLLTSFYFYLQKKYSVSVLLFAISILFKPLFCFFLIFFLIKKKLKFILILGGVLGVLTLFSVFYIGPSDYLKYFMRLSSEVSSLSSREVYFNQGFMGFVSRISPDFIIRKYSSLLFAFVMIFINVRLLLNKKIDDRVQFAFLIITFLLIDPLSWQHHFVYLIYPFVISGIIILKQKNYRLLFLLFVSYILVSINIDDFWNYYTFPASIILSHTFYGTLILLALLYKLGTLSKKR